MHSTSSLTNLRVLVTRPLHQAQLLAQCIEAQGGKPLIFPTIDIQPVPINLEHLEKLPTVDYIIFFSANAVHHLLEQIPSIQILLNKSHIIVIAIGPATAKSLTHRQVTVHQVPDHYSSEGLMALPALKDVAKKRIALVSGIDGDTQLADWLNKKGAQSIFIKTYKRVCPNQPISDKLALWQAKGLDVIIFTSFTCAHNFYTQVKKAGDLQWLLQQRILVVSPRIKRQLIKLGFQRIEIADNATDQALLKALERINEQNC